MVLHAPVAAVSPCCQINEKEHYRAQGGHYRFVWAAKQLCEPLLVRRAFLRFGGRGGSSITGRTPTEKQQKN